MSKTDIKTDHQINLECLNRFIDLANSIKDEGVDIKMVSHGLMTASGYYVTYALGGNDGVLSDLGMDEVTAAYRRELERIQKLKKEQVGSKVS
ncbi:MAG: DUF3144 domain-containing protein [Halioglobus sp.]|jgi:hypothetical protein|nr:DUF3144 domain-containing protein [Halioglobus sp.]